MTISAGWARRGRTATSAPAPTATWVRHSELADSPVAPPSAGVPIGSTALLILGALLLAFVGYLAGFGAVSHARTQQLTYAELRGALANGTVPIGPTDVEGHQLADGTPLGLIEGPGLREVVRESTTSRVLAGGPGHRRDSVLPGQPGISYIYGRRAAFGGPFRVLAGWHAGDRFTVVTGQGRQQFRVLDVRRAGDRYPALMSGTSRLVLVTADGPAYLPSGLLQVDADLVSPVQPSPVRAPVLVRASDLPLHGDSAALLPLVLWAQGLVLVSCLLVWAAARWGVRQAWVVGVPVVLALSVGVAFHASALLPNLL